MKLVLRNGPFQEPASVGAGAASATETGLQIAAAVEVAAASVKAIEGTRIYSLLENAFQQIPVDPRDCGRRGLHSCGHNRTVKVD
jgi:hypothetical protein